ncbi:MAG: YdjY domain-containing protein, partial [Maioricimonas sp. JB049]
LAVGAEPGHPVRFNPDFAPPSGQQIAIWLNWKDAEGKSHRVRAQRWVRHVTRRYYAAPLEKLPEGLTIPEASELKYDARHKELVWFGPMTEAQRDELKKLASAPAYRKAIDSFYERSQPRELDADWVFAGSGFYTQKNGEKWYQAEAGNVICVANFGDAMLDLAIQSSATNDALMFEPYTERIPPLGTPVTVELIPVTKPNGPAPSDNASGDSSNPEE